MSKQPSRTDIALAFLKTSATFTYNRCSQCGRRLKYKPGAWISSTGERFTTCRSCGYENPSLMEKVAENLIAAGYEIPQLKEGVLDLPQCMADGTELQVSRDFSKVFCSTCGREWDRYEFEDLMGGPLAPQLAGAIPLSIDNSKSARKLEGLLDQAGVDAGSPYLVLNVLEKDPILEESTVKWFFSEFKKGLAEGRKDQGSNPKANKTHYLAVYADSIAHYSWDGEHLEVDEVPFDILFQNPDANITIPFEVSAFKSEKAVVTGLLQRFRVMHVANQSPYSPELFGTAARDAEGTATTQSAPSTSLVDEIEKLASLRERGILSEEEFTVAKSKLLQ